MQWHPRTSLAIGAAVAVFLVGLIVGRMLTDGAAPEAAITGPGPAAHLPDAPAPQQPRGRFPRTRTGAVEAATAYGIAIDGPGLLDADARRTLLDEIATDDARGDLASTLAEGAEFIASNLGLTSDRIDDPGFVWRVVPGGWQVRSYDGARATVAIWATGLAVAEGRPLADPGWRTTEIDLAWERDDWRLVAFRSEPGPAPSLAADAADPTVGARINAFVAYEPAVADRSAGGTR